MNTKEKDKMVEDGVMEFCNCKNKKNLYILSRASDFFLRKEKVNKSFKESFPIIKKGAIPDYYYIITGIYINNIYKFIKKYGKSIIGIEENVLTIMIYDDYIE